MEVFSVLACLGRPIFAAHYPQYLFISWNDWSRMGILQQCCVRTGNTDSPWRGLVVNVGSRTGT
eukprot:scaffold858_cov171-Ochromonas_danica.AAC.4